MCDTVFKPIQYHAVTVPGQEKGEFENGKGASP